MSYDLLATLYIVQYFSNTLYNVACDPFPSVTYRRSYIAPWDLYRQRDYTQ